MLLRNHVSSKVCNESWVQQLTPFDSWTLTAGILLSKVLFFSNKRTRTNCVVFNKNEIYPLMSFLGKLSSDYGFTKFKKFKTKFNLEDLYLNIKQCILILMKNYTVWSHNLVLLLLKKELYLVKSRLWASMNQKVSAAVPNFRYKL